MRTSTSTEFHNGKNWEDPCVVHDLTDLSLLEQSQRSFWILTNFCACRTPSFADQLIEADNGLGEVMKPPEKSFWAKYVSNCTKYLLYFVQYLRVCVCVYACSFSLTCLFCSGCTSFRLVLLSWMLLRQRPTYQRKLQGRANLEQNGHLLLLPGGEDDGCLYVFPYRRYYHPFNYRHIVFCFFGYGVNITLTASSVVLHDDAIFCLCWNM